MSRSWSLILGHLSPASSHCTDSTPAGLTGCTWYAKYRGDMRVLLVEDEPRLSATLCRGLTAEGFVVVAVGTGVDGLHEATENSFDVVILDIMLPGHSGYEVLRRMRAQDVWTPVLMLT